MALWLREHGVESVAMESTGVYWIPVAEMLERHGIEVVLVDGRHFKNVPGRKTDVLDCQWLQELHSYGMLRGAFRPAPEIGALRSLWRQRESVVELASREVQHMHKALEQMNLQVHKALSDVAGKSGMAIVRAILSGERDALALARLADRRVHATETDLVKALTGHYQDHHVFVLRQAVELYDFFQAKVADCDREIEAQMRRLEPQPARGSAPAPAPARRARRKNQPHFDLRTEMFRVTGVDLTRIEGIETLTAQMVLTECGVDLSAFPSEKHFASWLGLCPNHEITGGRVRRRRTRKVANRVATALRVAAQSLHRSRTALGAFFRRLRARKGPAKAITATAHKLAIRVYRMLKYGQDYVVQDQERYEQRYRETQLQRLKAQAAALGLELVAADSGEVVS
jgi:transposase